MSTETWPDLVGRTGQPHNFVMIQACSISIVYAQEERSKHCKVPSFFPHNIHSSDIIKLLHAFHAAMKRNLYFPRDLFFSACYCCCEYPTRNIKCWYISLPHMGRSEAKVPVGMTLQEDFL